MKKNLLTIGLATLLLAACGNEEATNEPADASSAEQTTLKVASLIPPMTEILELVEPKLEEQGIDLEIVVLGDNVQPNAALAAKEVDANFFQHEPYMEEYNRNNDANLVAIQDIYFANYGVYAKEFDTIDALPDGATVAIANDVSNIDRSLALLAQHDVITLGDKKDVYYTEADITSNPKNLQFETVDLLMLARMYDDADAVVMTPAYAAPLGLTPKSDALLTEGIDNDFAITLVAREDNEDDAAIEALAEAMTSEEVRQLLEENYDETAIPAF